MKRTFNCIPKYASRSERLVKAGERIFYNERAGERSAISPSHQNGKPTGLVTSSENKVHGKLPPESLKRKVGSCAGNIPKKFKRIVLSETTIKQTVSDPRSGKVMRMGLGKAAHEQQGPSLGSKEFKKIIFCKAAVKTHEQEFSGPHSERNDNIKAWIHEVNSSNSQHKKGTCSTVSEAKSKSHHQGAITRVIRKLFNSSPSKSFKESHYVREDTSREFVEEGLNTAILYDKYVKFMKSEENSGVVNVTNLVGETQPQQSEEESTNTEAQSIDKMDAPKIATYRQYNDIFNSEFNIGYHLPKKDQCAICDQYFNSSAEKKVELKKNYDAHDRNKDLSRLFKEADKLAATKDPTLIFACFDLQKVLFTPQGKTSTFFYKRKLSVYNLTVYDGGKHIGRCYVWHEGEGGRGANDVSSCLLKFIELNVQHGAKEFRFYSDNCSGQNRNRMVFSMYRYAAAKFDIKITHRFLQTGHTQNEGDSVHACIERNSKGKKLYAPEDWYQVIASAKKKGTPYEVIRMKGSFLNLKNLCALQNWEKLEQNGKLEYASIKEVVVTNSDIITFKYSFEPDAPAYTLNVKKVKKGRPVNLETYQLPPSYNGPLKICAKKLKDLHDLCKSGAVPVANEESGFQYHDFYYNRLVGGTVIENGHDDVPEGF